LDSEEPFWSGWNALRGVLEATGPRLHGAYPSGGSEWTYVPPSRPAWGSNPRPSASERRPFCQLSCRWSRRSGLTHVPFLLGAGWAGLGFFASSAFIITGSESIAAIVIIIMVYRQHVSPDCVGWAGFGRAGICVCSRATHCSTSSPGAQRAQSTPPLRGWAFGGWVLCRITDAHPTSILCGKITLCDTTFFRSFERKHARSLRRSGLTSSQLP